MPTHRLKSRLREGETVFGVFLGIPSTPLAEIAGWAGFDYFFADTEHGPVHSESAVSMVRAAEATGTEAVVRVTSSERTNILRALDAGASGVLIPQVNSKEEGERAAAAAYYPPDGGRGIAFSIRAAHYGLWKSGEYLAAAKEETLVCVQVETRQAIDEVDGIASVPLIDVIFVGPTDLSMNLGFPGQLAHPEVEQAIDRIFEAAMNAGKIPAILANDPATAEKWMAKGARMLAANGTGIISKGMADLCSAFRSLQG